MTLASSALPAADAKPNILLIVADDLGWADVGYHGGKFRTPVIDGLVKTGVELDRHYVQPVCTPTRTALLSGRWTSRFGPHALQPSNLRVFPRGTMTLASALKEAGYSTHLSGKWHLGSREEWGPNHYGFDQSYGSFSGAVDPWTHGYRKGEYEKTWHRNGQRIDEEGNATELVTAQAVKWIESAKGPWLVYVPFQAVHIPVDTPPEYKKLYEGARFSDDPKKNESLQRFGAFVTQMDTKVGDLVAALERTGQRKNTLIVFTSDNGGLHSGGNAYVSQVPPTPALSSNLPLRGQKAQLYDGGIRVCAFANWPGTLQPRKVSAFMHAADWMPTLTKLAGWQPKETPKFDGRDVWPVISGKTDTLDPRPIYIPLGGGQVVLHDGWKLIARGAKSELFHVAVDIAEEKDLAETEPDRVKAMRSMLDDLRKDDLTKLPDDLKGIKG
ncbi:sulfatase-like hydrolase/transferase [Humisphaera borealis]|uniref:Sulfatase-like hydrolase/transferase n=1 Tax=Humisphaera borealis TaxID=2807512 RepID=A0A7M2WSW6_9BACT|nr:sulfatase-like hydrolase/transferase [Humisphaera borealis]QOV87690.1 sulfatase-like hydrolase/transferase [Humisphaera borealis]